MVFPKISVALLLTFSSHSDLHLLRTVFATHLPKQTTDCDVCVSEGASCGGLSGGHLFPREHPSPDGLPGGWCAKCLLKSLSHEIDKVAGLDFANAERQGWNLDDFEKLTHVSCPSFGSNEELDVDQLLGSLEREIRGSDEETNDVRESLLAQVSDLKRKVALYNLHFSDDGHKGCNIDFSASKGEHKLVRCGKCNSEGVVVPQAEISADGPLEFAHLPCCPAMTKLSISEIMQRGAESEEREIPASVEERLRYVIEGGVDRAIWLRVSAEEGAVLRGKVTFSDEKRAADSGNFLASRGSSDRQEVVLPKGTVVKVFSDTWPSLWVENASHLHVKNMRKEASGCKRDFLSLANNGGDVEDKVPVMTAEHLADEEQWTRIEPTSGLGDLKNFEVLNSFCLKHGLAHSSEDCKKFDKGAESCCASDEAALKAAKMLGYIKSCPKCKAEDSERWFDENACSHITCQGKGGHCGHHYWYCCGADYPGPCNCVGGNTGDHYRGTCQTANFKQRVTAFYDYVYREDKNDQSRKVEHDRLLAENLPALLRAREHGYKIEPEIAAANGTSVHSFQDVLDQLNGEVEAAREALRLRRQELETQLAEMERDHEAQMAQATESAQENSRRLQEELEQAKTEKSRVEDAVAAERVLRREIRERERQILDADYKTRVEANEAAYEGKITEANSAGNDKIAQIEKAIAVAESISSPMGACSVEPVRYHYEQFLSSLRDELREATDELSSAIADLNSDRETEISNLQGDYDSSCEDLNERTSDDEDKICSALGFLSIFDCQSNIDEAERAWRDSLPGGCENEADELRQRLTDELNAHRDLISNPETDGETVRLQDALTAAEDAVREAQETHLQAAW